MNLLKYKKNKSTRGFTLVELLVVISIIGIMGTVVVRLLNPDAHKRNAEDAVTRVHIEDLTAAILSYRELEGKLPTVVNIDGDPVPSGGTGMPGGPEIDEYIDPDNWPEDFIYYPIDDENFVIEAPTSDSTPDEPEYIVYNSESETTGSCDTSPCYDPGDSEETDPGDTTIPVDTAACEDSDGGKDSMTAGYVSYKNDEYSDSCKDNETLVEYFCNSSDNVGYIDMPCAHGCESSACLEEVIPDCNDTDNGKNYSVRGTASNGVDTLTDSCTNNVLTEYFCSDGSIETDTYTCPDTCSEGACIEIVVDPVVCTDSDGGKDYFERGNTVVGEKSYTDSCDGLLLTEYFCDGNTADKVTYTCEGLCKTGACLEFVQEELTYNCETIARTGCVNLTPTFSFGTPTVTQKCPECSGSSFLKSYICPLGINPVTMTQVEEAARYSSCPSGLCENGACTEDIIEQVTCIDSDTYAVSTGIAPYTFGRVTVGGQTFSDTCDGNRVREYYCVTSTSKTASSVLQTCLNTCEGGECTSSAGQIDDGGTIIIGGGGGSIIDLLRW